MTDMRQTIKPKSDQLNADDLIGTTRTIRVTKVSLLTDDAQPIAIHFDGDGGKPYKPGKSMRRVMVNAWGPDGASYAGRSLTLYRDDKVVFGGLAVGGIRISHMSHIDGQITMALTATKASRKPFTVHPLVVDAGPEEAARDAASQGTAAYRKFWSALNKDQQSALLPLHEDLKAAAKVSDELPDVVIPGEEKMQG